MFVDVGSDSSIIVLRVVLTYEEDPIGVIGWAIYRIA